MFGIKGSVRQQWGPTNSLIPIGGPIIQFISVTNYQVVQTPQIKGLVGQDCPPSDTAANGVLKLPTLLPSPWPPPQVWYLLEQLTGSERGLITKATNEQPDEDGQGFWAPEPLGLWSWARATLPDVICSSTWKLPKFCCLGDFMEASFRRHDWLNHWPWWLSYISGLPLPRGWGWGWKF